MRVIAMFVSSLLVCGATALTLFWFFRRLKRIESDMWRDRAEEAERLLRRQAEDAD